MFGISYGLVSVGCALPIFISLVTKTLNNSFFEILLNFTLYSFGMLSIIALLTFSTLFSVNIYDKFNKFVSRLRKKFSKILVDALKTQLVLKGIINEDDWDGISENIFVDFLKDNYFAELKEFEIMRDRFDMMSQVESLVEQGYYSKQWVRKNILGQDEQEIGMIDKQINDEIYFQYD